MRSPTYKEPSSTDRTGREHVRINRWLRLHIDRVINAEWSVVIGAPSAPKLPPSTINWIRPNPTGGATQCLAMGYLIDSVRTRNERAEGGAHSCPGSCFCSQSFRPDQQLIDVSRGLEQTACCVAHLSSSQDALLVPNAPQLHPVQSSES